MPAPPQPPDGALQLGQFTVDPAEVVVKPGCKQQVSVVFRAEGSRSWASTLGLDISERDPKDQAAGIPYELGGESVIPGELQEHACRCHQQVWALDFKLYKDRQLWDCGWVACVSLQTSKELRSMNS